MAVEIMTFEDKIEVAAAAMYQSRNLRTWKTLQYHRPDIAQIYRENARVMIGAIKEAETAIQQDATCHIGGEPTTRPLTIQS